MNEGHKSLRRIAYLMMAVATLIFVVAFFFKFTVRDESYTFAEAWNRGLIQGVLVVNGALIVIAFGLLALQPWARWADCVWGVALAANALITEAWHYGSVDVWSFVEAVLISTVWGWLSYRYLFAPNVSALFTKSVDV